MPRNPHRNRPFIMNAGYPKTKRLAAERLMLNLRALEREGGLSIALRDLVPEAWDTLERDVDVEEKKVKVTLRLDESVAKFYRAMGKGYQARINRVLATFAQMRITEAVRAHAGYEDEIARMDREMDEEIARREREERARRGDGDA